MAEGKIIQVALRLSPEMHQKVKEMAIEDRRSLHAEILEILDQAIERREAEREVKLAA